MTQIWIILNPSFTNVYVVNLFYFILISKHTDPLPTTLFETKNYKSTIILEIFDNWVCQWMTPKNVQDLTLGRLLTDKKKQ